MEVKMQLQVYLAGNETKHCRKPHLMTKTTIQTSPGAHEGMACAWHVEHI